MITAAIHPTCKRNGLAFVLGGEFTAVVSSVHGFMVKMPVHFKGKRINFQFSVSNF